MKARLVGHLKAKPVYRYIVTVSKPVGEDDWEEVVDVPVLSDSAQAALKMVRQEHPARGWGFSTIDETGHEVTLE